MRATIIRDETRLGGESNPLEISLDIKICTFTKEYIHKHESVLLNEREYSTVFYDTNGSPNLGQKTRPNDCKQN